MTRIVVDASAFAAVVFREPGFEAISRKLDRAEVYAPRLLQYELVNTAWKKARREPSKTAVIFASLAHAVDDRWGIVWCDVDAADVAVLAHATGLTGYDAAYVWLAGSLGADLVTLDRQLAKLSPGAA